MKAFLSIIALALTCLGCAPKDLPDLSYRGPQIGECYVDADEAFKVIGVADGRVYYKHSWNDQDKVFSSRLEIFRGRLIACDKTGYEFEVLAFSVKSMKDDIRYLKELTEPLRKNRK